MSPQACWEYMKTVQARYQQAKGRREKGLILDEFCKTYGDCHRKHAIRTLNAPPPGATRPARRPRGSVYGRGRVPPLLVAVWEASELLCGQRLHAAMPLWMDSIRARFRTTPEEERLLLSISPATIDRRLKPWKARRGRRLYGATRPGRLLKHHIPIKTDCWDVDRPGFAEVDLVSHSGDCAEGEFAYTLNVTDVFSGWVERRCVLGKGQEGVARALDDIRRHLPFPLLGIGSDNGSEFINNHLWDYCQAKPRLQFTRGRPYKKDDNAHVEQKNWTHVRRLVGYGRYETQAAVDALNDLYRGELRSFQNLFLPSVKLRSKTQVGSKTRRKYEDPKTPFDRVADSGSGVPTRISELRLLRARLDPFALSEAIDRRLERIWAMRSKAPKPSWLKPGYIPSYRRDPLEGMPHTPEPWPGIEPYDKILTREKALQTWT